MHFCFTIQFFTISQIMELDQDLTALCTDISVAVTVSDSMSSNCTSWSALFPLYLNYCNLLFIKKRQVIVFYRFTVTTMERLCNVHKLLFQKSSQHLLANQNRKSIRNLTSFKTHSWNLAHSLHAANVLAISDPLKPTDQPSLIVALISPINRSIS